MKRFLFLFFISAFSIAEDAETAVDPFESTNRIIFQISDDLDTVVLKPVAEIYRDTTPKFVKNSLTNFFYNLSEVDTIVNQLLQGKIVLAGQDTLRFLINSTIGIGGFFDVATKVGLERHDEDFGQTLGYWGVPSGPYVFLPVIGPSTVRDSFSKPTSWFLSGNLSVSDDEAKIIINLLDAVETRERLLVAEKLIVGDKYEFVKSVYLQTRNDLVFDGEVEDEFLTDLELDLFSEDPLSN
ncbi:VacJ family lipoprotein [SAR86 cluster bacterium]|jgi:phospholipid-binding lipoprotein MlaA|uniref:VacJ family lipoprotein n=1 Tax=SAR86 cluster bacterium TaxID=2030880 RepID=A0A9Q8X0T0_9GAMM|nr:VacJ family lipoprotein [SAR86 cluster bacterium]|tara:strand:+ start:699 stop:1418 length:720 start_codon:yes stop_codon:yes gene_type:complete